MSQESPDDARIRALLAELGSSPDRETVPPEVAARLEDTLGRLVAERDVTSVLPMRRRLLPRAAVAAAAVIVLGVGGVSLASLGLFDSSDSSESSASSDADAGAGSRSEAPSDGALENRATDPRFDQPRPDQPRIGAGTFVGDVTALLRRPAAVTTPEQRRERSEAKRPPRPPFDAQGCTPPRSTTGAAPNRVVFAGKPAVLMIHPTRGGSRLVEAWDCSGQRRLAAARVATATVSR